MAKLAGVPDKVITRARHILKELEAGGVQAPQAPAAPATGQMSLMDMGGGEVVRRLQGVDLNTLTPIEAMNLLFELKQLV